MAFIHAEGTDSPKAGKVEVQGRLLRDDRPKAILINDGKNDVWLPRRFIAIEKIGGDVVGVCMPKWLAKQKGYL